MLTQKTAKVTSVFYTHLFDEYREQLQGTYLNLVTKGLVIERKTLFYLLYSF